MRVALYIRRSTNELLQADSLRSQTEILTQFAADGGHQIVKIYSDSASGRSTDDRDEFKSLLNDVRRNAKFESILVLDVSRWGRFENPDEAAFYEWLCLSHGVQVIYVNENFGPEETPLGALQKSMKRWMAAEFSRDKGRTVQRSQSRVVKLGFMHGGPAPFGMKRVLVQLDGTYVADLKRGDRKALSNMRVKLAPGDPAQVKTVRRMFDMYADGMALGDIAKALDAEGVKGSQGGRWQPAMVSYVLRNEVYIGVAKYTHTKSRSPSELRNISDDPSDESVIRVPGSYEPIIERSVWDAAQERMRTRTWRRTDLDLAKELRAAFERWGHVEARMLESVEGSAHWTTYKNRFRRGYPEALEVAYAAEIDRAKSEFRDLLSTRFQVRDFENGWLIDDLLYVAFKYSWPRASRAGLAWPFPFEGDELEDVTVGFGFTPPPDVRAVERFFFQRWRFTNRKQLVSRTLSARRSPQRFVAPKTPEEVFRFMQTAIYFRNVRAEKRLLEAVSDLPLVVVSKLARQLGWPENATRLLYLKLLARGAPVPPMKGKHGRRIDVVCPACGGVRKLRVSDAMQRRTDVCFECTNRRPAHKVTATCPECGAEREMYPSAVAAMRQGPDSLCHSCAMAKGRAIRKVWLEKRKTVEAERRRALTKVAVTVLASMTAEPATYINPRWWTRGRPRNPTLRWVSSAGLRCRLAISCADQDAEWVEAHAVEHFLVAQAVERARWTPVRCDGRNDEGWLVQIGPESDVVAT